MAGGGSGVAVALLAGAAPLGCDLAGGGSGDAVVAAAGVFACGLFAPTTL